MSTPTKDEYLQSCSDWFSFHLSHVEDFEFAVAESLWSECDKCRAVYESLNYTSHEGEFGLMTREFLENLMKRQRDRPKLVSSLHVRRGNVPQYVSFVSPMPVHLRPGTGESSGYGGSPKISIVSEDLLISAGTQEEFLDESEETGLEIGVKDGRLGLGEEDEAALKKDFDETRQDILISPSSLLPKVSLSQYAADSALDEEGSILDVGSSPRDDDENDAGDMVKDEFEIGKDGDEGRRNSTDTEGTDFNFEGMRNGFKSGLTNSSEDDFDQHLDNNLATDVDGFNDSDTNGNRGTYEDNDDVGDASALDGTTNDVDSSSFEDQDPTKMENNLQVTFSEPLATDGRLPPNVADNVDDENGGKPRSILKGNDDTKDKISELEVEPYIMKRKISSVETSKTLSQKPVVGNSGTDLRSQNKPNINILNETARAMKKELNESEDEEDEANNDDDDNSSDDEYILDRGGRKVRRPKPKNSIYAKRANLKARSEKLHKRKTSESDQTEDGGMTAESSLLMQQILDEEKRLKNGMKPWLKGRLGLSQQNSRFEIPMDVRLLETMTPLDYLTNYCVISKRRKALYKHVFQRVDRNRGGSITYAELEKGLTDVHTGVLDSGHIENITKMININKESSFDLKQFSGIAAFSERISCKFQLPVELLNSLDGQKEVIESADFFALSWKLDGIHVNPGVKKILDSL